MLSMALKYPNKTKFWNDAVASDDLPLDVDLPLSLMHAYLKLEEDDLISRAAHKKDSGNEKVIKASSDQSMSSATMIVRFCFCPAEPADLRDLSSPWRASCC
jgi:hypothetical protein